MALRVQCRSVSRRLRARRGELSPNLPAQATAADASVPAPRVALRARKAVLGGAFRGPLRLLAGLLGQGGRTVSRLRYLGAGLRPRSLRRVPLRDARALLLQAARVVPLVRRQARLW